jgi:hypothetical protein
MKRAGRCGPEKFEHGRAWGILRDGAHSARRAEVDPWSRRRFSAGRGLAASELPPRRHLISRGVQRAIPGDATRSRDCARCVWKHPRPRIRGATATALAGSGSGSPQRHDARCLRASSREAHRTRRRRRPAAVARACAARVLGAVARRVAICRAASHGRRKAETGRTPPSGGWLASVRARSRRGHTPARALCWRSSGSRQAGGGRGGHEGAREASTTALAPSAYSRTPHGGDPRVPRGK